MLLFGHAGHNDHPPQMYDAVTLCNTISQIERMLHPLASHPDEPKPEYETNPI